jgi:CRP/FNR family transcriptional regulator, putaive post-exponential-phase nitrogen-starvation regulator
MLTLDPRIEAYVNRFQLNRYLSTDLLRTLRLRHVLAQQTLLNQAGELTHLYWLVEGRMQVNYAHADGKCAVWAALTPLAIIGDLELFHNLPLQANVLCLETATLLSVEKSVALRFGADDPRFLRLLIDQLTHKLLNISVIQAPQLQALPHRLAHYLLQKDTPIVPFDSKTHLAAWFGVTPRHLNRVLAQWQRDGLVQVQLRQIQIIDRIRLSTYTSS